MTTEPKRPTQANLSSFLSRYGAVLILLALCAVFAIISPRPNGENAFLSQFNILNIIRQVSVVGIIAVGMTYVILLGQIDLGVGSVVGLVGMLSAIMLRSWGFGIVPTVLIALLVGAVTGLLVGLLVTKGNVPSFVATLGVLAAYRGITLLIGGQPVIISNDAFSFIGTGYIGPIPVPIIIFAIVVAAGAITLRRTRFGRYVYAVGGNETAARLAGINVDLIKIAVFVICGLCTAIASLIVTSRLSSGQPNAGTGYELDVIAAVVVGGTSLAGGRGSVMNTIVGAMLIGVLNNGLDLKGVPGDAQPIFKGIIIVAAVLLDQIARRRRR